MQAALVMASPLAFAAIAILLGKKTGWDFYNYPWYNPFALTNDRFGFDVAVAHHATYSNPLSDLPLYWLVSIGPAWLGGAFMGAMAGIVVVFIGVLAYSVLPCADASKRTTLAALCAVVGAFGAGAFQEIGDPANDIPAAIGILAALVIIVRSVNAKDAETNRVAVGTLLLAGSLAGAAVALKLTIAVYALGVGGALLWFSGSPMQRIARSALFSAGAAGGLLLVGGFWMLKLWRYSGNPFLPYFNDVFHSSLLVATSYRDPSFRPDSFLTALLYPVYFTLESRTVSESVFRDAHILILYVLLPLTLIVRLAASRLANQAALSNATTFLFAFAAIAYFAWLAVFDIYRYLIPLEMLAPLLIALAVAAWPIRPVWQLAVTVMLLATAQLLVRVDLSDRQTWSGRYVDVAAPALAAPERTMILLAGHAPMAYVIPFFPREIPFVRIDGWLVQGGDRITGLARAMRARVAGHSGSLYMLFAPVERELVLDAAKNYDLELILDERFCRVVTSNIDDPLWLCPVVKSQRSVPTQD